MKMKTGPVAALTALMCLSGAAFAQARVDAGKQEYDWQCAICHGASGRGDGEMSKWLAKRPSDLTTIAKRNGGTFPNELMWSVIDGRTAVPGHGTREMPVWGQRFRTEAQTDPQSAAAPEWAVRNRIVSLLDYLSRIQAK